MSYERDIIDLINSAQRNANLRPLNLGGTSSPYGGTGGPPGGIVGVLPQTKVAYDESELAAITTSGTPSLLDNLNHIRYEIENIVVGSGILGGVEEAPNTSLLYGRKNESWEEITISGGSGAGVPIATAGGTVDAITADFTPNIALVDKQLCAVVVAGANTIYDPYFAPDGLTSHSICKNGGQPLVAGDIPGEHAVILLEYNSSHSRWELLNPASVSLNVPEGATLYIGTDVPTTSKIQIGDGYSFIYEKYDDCIAIDAGMTTPGLGDGLVVGWDATYANHIAQLGDISNQDHGNFIQVDLDGVTISGGLLFPPQHDSAPSYIKGGMYFDTTLNKLCIGGVVGWETLFST